MRRLLALLSVASALCAPATVPAATPPRPDALQVSQVLDLHYGDALFYFYQDENFEAITRLTAYEHWGRMPHHQNESQLVLGGLFLSLGMYEEASARFQK